MSVLFNHRQKERASEGDRERDIETQLKQSCESVRAILHLKRIHMRVSFSLEEYSENKNEVYNLKSSTY